MIYYDIHTHQPPVHSDDKVIVAADFRMPLDPEIAYAVGIHPWQAASNNALPILYELAQQPNVFAIGETGLDKRCATPFDRQEELFRVHIQLAEAMNKPLIIHCVKAWEQLLHMHKTSGRRIAWIIHGFTGNKTLAGQLLRAGFYLSFGLRFNPNRLRAAAPDVHINCLPKQTKALSISAMYMPDSPRRSPLRRMSWGSKLQSILGKQFSVRKKTT